MAVRQDEKSPDNSQILTQGINQMLGKRLKEIRKSYNMTQQALGEHLGVSFQQIQKYEKGTSAMRVETLYEICEYLGVHPGFFMYAIPFTTTNKSLTEEKRKTSDIQRLVGAVVKFPPNLREPFVHLCEVIPTINNLQMENQAMLAKNIEKTKDEYVDSPNSSGNPTTNQRSFSISFIQKKNRDK